MDLINAAQSEFFMFHFNIILQVTPLVFQAVLFSYVFLRKRLIRLVSQYMAYASPTSFSLI
jgi:hypothetical protein